MQKTGNQWVRSKTRLRPAFTLTPPIGGIISSNSERMTLSWGYQLLSRHSVFAAAAALFLTAPASAHHSHVQYDMTQYTRVEGVVAEVHWFNPHAWLYISTTGEDGEPVIWALEATGPGGLQRNGITRDMIQVGDSISARCHQLLDGSNGCLLGYLTGADGVERLWD